MIAIKVIMCYMFLGTLCFVILKHFSIGVDTSDGDAFYAGAIALFWPITGPIMIFYFLFTWLLKAIIKNNFLRNIKKR